MSARPDWRQLDQRTLWASAAITTGSVAAAAVPAAVAMLIAGIGPGWIAVWSIGATVLSGLLTVLSELIRLRTTRYRIDDHRIERKVELLGSRQISLAIERVRNVEVSADITQRWLGVATVTVSGGRSSTTRLRLHAVDASLAEDLRARLLRSVPTGEGEQLAALRPSWVRYAPFSALSFLIGALAYGALLQTADWFDAVPNVLDAATTVLDAPWPVVVLVILAAGTVVGALGTGVVFFEGWWGYRLRRHPDGSLQLRRGLLVVRQTSFDGRRIRGVTVHEPPGLRAVRAGRLQIIAVGATAGEPDQQASDGGSMLMPGAPLRESIRVAEAATGIRWPSRLRPHPPAARRRRMVRAAILIVAVSAVAVLLSVMWSLSWHAPVTAAMLTAAVSLTVALDNARALGHALTASHVVLRKGSWRRRTDVLESAGILAWTIRRSPMQARAGLITLTATSAAGNGWFRLPDVGVEQAAAVLGTAGEVWQHLAIAPKDARNTENTPVAAYTDRQPRDEGKP